MPGHSRGSICLHDRENKLLFSGDVVYDGSMIDWLPYSRVSDYISSCERLVGLVDSEQVEQLPLYNAQKLCTIQWCTRLVEMMIDYGFIHWTGWPSPPRTLQHFWCQAAQPDCIHIYQQSWHVSCQVLHICLENCGWHGTAGDESMQCLLMRADHRAEGSTSTQKML